MPVEDRNDGNMVAEAGPITSGFLRQMIGPHKGRLQRKLQHQEEYHPLLDLTINLKENINRLRDKKRAMLMERETLNYADGKGN